MNNMCNSKVQTLFNINVLVEDVLTPLTCSCLVNEILKCLVYQKSQIPYPYNWLKNAVGRKRKQDDNKRSNLTVQKHYHVASTAYDTLEEIMTNIDVELREAKDNFNGLMIVFGSTLLSAKEVYVLRLPNVAKGHDEKNHEESIHKSKHKVLKNIFFSDEWISIMDNSLQSTNMYIMMNKSSPLISKDFFVPQHNFTINPKTKHIVITLNYNESNSNCCDSLKIFSEDEEETEVVENKRQCKPEWNGTWYQAKGLLKGFKDCFVNKVSASELW